MSSDEPMGNLSLSRRAGEGFRIGQDVHVQVIAVDNYHARIRITAPKSVEIMRNELDEHAEVSMEITSCG